MLRLLSATVAAAATLATGLTATAPASAAARFPTRLAQAQLASTGEPEVSNVGPATGPFSGGTAVGIGGKHFTGATEVRFGSTAAVFTVKSDGKIEAVSPPGSEGTLDVTVTTPEGTSATSRADHFSYVPPGPSIVEVQPNEGDVEGNRPVKILGAHFEGVTAVSFGETPVSFEVLTPETIGVSTPPGSFPTVDVRVSTGAGTSPIDPRDQYHYTTRPIEVASVEPNQGPAVGGTSVTIEGLRFYGVTGVDFGSVPAPSFTQLSTTEIIATAPSHTVERTNVFVQTTFGPSAIEYCAHHVRNGPCRVKSYFKYKEPVITGVSPQTGSVAGGTSVTFSGHGFAVGVGKTEFLFGKAPATSVECALEASCTAVTPPGIRRGRVYVKTGALPARSKKNPEATFEYE